jgi:rare lipoprotein A
MFIQTFLVTLFMLCIITQQNPAVTTGKASYYADKFIGKPTASGESYKATELTAAHRTLPFGTKLKVTNITNKKSVVVRVNDRGPQVKGRIIDVSRRAAEELDMIQQGIAMVTIEVLSED